MEGSFIQIMCTLLKQLSVNLINTLVHIILTV